MGMVLKMRPLIMMLFLLMKIMMTLMKLKRFSDRASLSILKRKGG
jgi:hypothetical protein